QHRQDMSADCDTRTDAECAKSIPVPHFLLHLVKKRDNMDGIFVEFLSTFCRCDVPADPVKEPDAIIFLQFTYGKAYGRLGKMQFLSCFCNTVLLEYRYQYSHVAKCHVRFPFLASPGPKRRIKHICLVYI